jgi:hypothetical protein
VVLADEVVQVPHPQRLTRMPTYAAGLSEASADQAGHTLAQDVR